MIEADGSDRRTMWSRRWPWLALLLFSAALHLWQLGDRSFHHDEAIHAQLSYELATEHRYRYVPTFHGPVLYYLTAGSFLVGWDSDFIARLPIALSGIALLWVAWRLRRPFGERAAWWTGLLATISPLFLFYGRFLRMDVLEVLFASLAALSAYRAVRGRRRAWIWFAVWAGLAFATKENAYVTSALVVLTLAILALSRGLVDSWRWGAGFLRQHGADLAAAFAVFILVTIPIYTVAFSFPGDWLFPVRAISYWWEQHTVERVGGPWWFHLPRLLQYEFLILGAGTAWIIRRGRQASDLERSLFVFGVMSIGMYVYLGEKVPWLGVHQVWPFLPLAGAQLARTTGPKGRWWSRAIAAAGVAATVVVSLTANFVLEEISPNRRRVESLHFVQTCPEFTDFARGVVERSSDGDEDQVVATGQAVWPLKWHWRHLNVGWSLPRAGQNPAVVVCDPEQAATVRERLGDGYVESGLPLRAWWLMYVGDPTLRETGRYFLTRDPWSEIGSTDVVVFRRSG